MGLACWFAAFILFCQHITGSAAHVAPVIRIFLAFPEGLESSSGMLCSCSGVTAELLRSHSSGILEALQAGWMKALPRENQVKLTVSVPPSLHVLLRSWAHCEGRELTSVVLQCVELSVRQLKSNGSIPAGAIRNYELACEERLAASGLGGA